MRRILAVTLLLALVAGAAVLSGCGSGKVSVETGDAKVEVDTDKGSLSIDTNAPTEEEIGIPVYPGATSEGSIDLSESGESAAAAVLWSDDDANKVIAWYKEELSGKSEYNEIQMSEEGNPALMITYRDGSSIKMVTIGVDQYDHPGKTRIGLGGGTVK
jgi:hypothetical protein